MHQIRFYVGYMTQRHPIQNGQIMLVTTVAKGRAPLFSNPALAREAVESLYRTLERYPVFLHGFVVMPDHIHLLVQPIAPMTISFFMSRYKTNVSLSIGIGEIWQSRFHILVIADASKALAYIHNNPWVKGLCEIPEDYPWSSASGRWDISPLDV